MDPEPRQDATFTGLFLSFLRLGLTAFGGPAMVAYIRDMAVKRRRWLDADSFQEGVALVQAVPGATAMQMAAYVGLRSRGITGGLVSYVAFGLPAFVLILILSVLYTSALDVPRVLSLFTGLQVLVVAIVANATWSFGRELVRGLRVALIALAAAALLGLGISPFIVIAGAAAAGIILFHGSRPAGNVSAKKEKQRLRLNIPGLAILLALLAVCLALLFFLNLDRFHLAILMLRIDIFAFGGGFASLPLMLYEIVDVRGWMDSQTFMNGIALGQVTPGPIVMTATFVGYLVYGLSGAVIAAAAIFTPSFLVLVVVMPFFDRIKTSPLFARATAGILASFVGLLTYVTIKFAVAVPWDVLKVLLGAAALAALLKKVDILYVVLAGAAFSFLFIR